MVIDSVFFSSHVGIASIVDTATSRYKCWPMLYVSKQYNCHCPCVILMMQIWHLYLLYNWSETLFSTTKSVFYKLCRCWCRSWINSVFSFYFSHCGCCFKRIGYLKFRWCWGHFCIQSRTFFGGHRDRLCPPPTPYAHSCYNLRCRYQLCCSCPELGSNLVLVTSPLCPSGNTVPGLAFFITNKYVANATTPNKAAPPNAPAKMIHVLSSSSSATGDCSCAARDIYKNGAFQKCTK